MDIARSTLCCYSDVEVTKRACLDMYKHIDLEDTRLVIPRLLSFSSGEVDLSEVHDRK
jgi:hypothetical protein